MSLKGSCLRAAVETTEQFDACLADGSPELIYLDSAFTDPEEYSILITRAHGAGIRCGLRLPFIWTGEAESYFDRILEKVRRAGFDLFLFRNTESIFYFAEHGLLRETPYLTDHGVYVHNPEAEKLLLEMLPAGFSGITLPLELNGKELQALNRARKERPGALSSELAVYGRAPMMVSAQCVSRTVGRCDHRERTLLLKDRTGAEMPVKNVCRFCYNVIYNSVPTVLTDLEKDLQKIAPDSYRYEFTTESGAETAGVLKGDTLSAFTRGHFRRGV